MVCWALESSFKKGHAYSTILEWNVQGIKLCVIDSLSHVYVYVYLLLGCENQNNLIPFSVFESRN